VHHPVHLMGRPPSANCLQTPTLSGCACGSMLLTLKVFSMIFSTCSCRL